MASATPNKLLQKLLTTAFNGVTYKVILVNGFVLDKDLHQFRSDITNELATGGGYTAGGVAITPTITLDNTNDRVDMAFPQLTIDPATFSATSAVYVAIRGGAASADDIIGFNDFGGTKSPAGVPFVIGASTYRLSNP